MPAENIEDRVTVDTVKPGDIPELLDRYWDLGHARGHSGGRPLDGEITAAQAVRTLLNVAFIRASTVRPVGEPFAWRVRAKGAHKQHWMIQTDPVVADFYRKRTTNDGGPYEVDPLFL